MKIALDAGHGASRGHAFTGAHGNGLIEDYLALDFVTRIGHHLRAAGQNTVFTRPTKTLTSLSKRGKMAVAADCDLFLSIHLNAGAAQANGVEALVAENDKRSFAIAKRLAKVISAHGLRNRGAKWDSQSQHSKLRVLRDTYRHMPAVLLEIGFVTNTGDAALLADKHYRETIAYEIAEVCISN